MTIDPAYASFTEDILGSITPGKLADFVVLSKDIMRVAPVDVLSTRVVATSSTEYRHSVCTRQWKRFENQPLNSPTAGEPRSVEGGGDIGTGEPSIEEKVERF